jgi:acyl-coenzyme A synthetase/AMP-(fatty) acid ligase
MGKPSPGIELAIHNASGDKVIHEEGEIAILLTPKTEHLVFKGYRKGTDGNYQVVRPEKIDKHGQKWYYTGDRAYEDGDGYFWFVGRDDDVPHLFSLMEI